LKDGTLMGQQAPNFKLMTSDGQSLELAGFRGKMLMLDFWATWCFACAEEVPALEKIQGNGETAPIVLGITAETAAPVRDWLKDPHILTAGEILFPESGGFATKVYC
jgi:peroxiredoxin